MICGVLNPEKIWHQ